MTKNKNELSQEEMQKNAACIVDQIKNSCAEYKAYLVQILGQQAANLDNSGSQYLLLRKNDKNDKLECIDINSYDAGLLAEDVVDKKRAFSSGGIKECHPDSILHIAAHCFIAVKNLETIVKNKEDNPVSKLEKIKNWANDSKTRDYFRSSPDVITRRFFNKIVYLAINCLTFGMMPENYRLRFMSPKKRLDLHLKQSLDAVSQKGNTLASRPI